MKSICRIAPPSAALVVILLHGAFAGDLSSKDVYDSSKEVLDGSIAPHINSPSEVRLSIKSWGIMGDRRGDSMPQEIPVQGFYIAHVLTGEIIATIDGATTRHSPGDYWAVKLGAIMQVKALGDYAMLETTVIAKQ
jgi:hypothetical protein